MNIEVKPPRMMYTRWALVIERWSHAIVLIGSGFLRASLLRSGRSAGACDTVEAGDDAAQDGKADDAPIDILGGNQDAGSRHSDSRWATLLLVGVVEAIRVVETAPVAVWCSRRSV